MTIDSLLQCIGSTEESSFGEVCQALGDDKPADRSEWGAFFRSVEDLERQGLIEVSRVNGKIDSMILTEAGAARVRTNNKGV